MAVSPDGFSLPPMKIQLILISASDIMNVDIFPNSKAYAVAWIEDGSRPSKQKTMAKEFDSNPTWNKLMIFILDEEALEQDRLCLKLELRMKETTGSKKIRRKIRMKKTTGGKKVGEVSIPMKFLVKLKNGHSHAEFWSYRVRNPSGKITGKLNLTFQVEKPESESNAKEIAAPQRKKRKKNKVPLIKSEPKSNAKESAAPKRKKGKKVPLTTSTEFVPPTIDPPPLLLPLPPHPHVGYPQYPLHQPYPHQGGPGYTPSSGYPSYPRDYPQQAGYPYPPYPPYAPPDYTQQAGYPYPPCSPYTPQAAAPPPPPPLSHASYPQNPTPGGQYPPQQPYPQQGGFNTHSGYSGW